jgi:CheY-like chemotaxis protein/two-component sensor histidine kinase
MLGHELRNPLSPILSALRILQLPGADPAATRMANESIAHQTRHLTRIVDGILDVTRVSSGKIELRTEVIDLGSVIRRALDLTGSLIESKHHQVSVGLPDASILIHGDATRLEQVFVNLLNNASKYMSAYGRIAIRAQRCGPDVEVSVEDEGVGLSTELRPRIFELFTQEERSLDRSPGGLGVGLWMVRKLVELHGGSVDAYSEGSGKGSRFVVRLPGAASSSAASSSAASSSAPTDGNRLPGERAATEAASHRVLVVDDNRDGADNLALLCRMSGHAAEVAYDGIAALGLATTFRPDVVLLDIGLPRRDGYEVARELRLACADRLTIIAMTGYGGEADRSRSRDAGFDLHLVKPVEPRWLLDLLSRPIDAMLDANS